MLLPSARTPRDATHRDPLIKVLARLSSFEGRSRFRTWLYRIVVSRVLGMQRGQGGSAASVHRLRLTTAPELDATPGPGGGRSQRHIGRH